MFIIIILYLQIIITIWHFFLVKKNPKLKVLQIANQIFNILVQISIHTQKV